WMEGFAAFMAVVIANHYDRWWAEGPLEKSPAGYPMAGSLDTNYRAWMYEGRAEEYAIASFLWDCIDSEEKKFNAKGVWSLASGQVFGDFFFDGWDHNNDGIATREEISIGVLLMLFGDPIDSVIYPPNIILIAGVTEDLGDFDIEPDMNIFETYDDGDDILNEDELENMAEIIDNGYYQKPYKIADKWIELYDDDGNGNISLEEAKKILKVHEIIMDLQGKNSTADWDDIKTWLDSEYLAPFMGKLINKFCMGLPDDGWTRDEFDSYILKNVTREDDDYTNWSFEKLWGEVLSRKHKDFSSVLYWFPIENEEERKDLFWLLRLHGMYQKKLKGNGVYDSGEAYNDTNNNQNWDPGEPFIDYPPTWTISPGDIYGSPSNYQRIGRNSTPYFKGQYIKTPDGEYDISYIIMNGFNITDVIVYSAESEDGMLYVPIPPESFIGIFETNKRDKGPLVTFSSNYFNTNYEEIIERGYITSIENKNDMNNDPNIPLGMIAILLVICTILIGVFIKIKKKKEK
ncbi:MAG: hypothetical protein KGY67_06825, partial [Candidatus Thermoplasmatota archaeon]|nr:hypothetical protein [Candidatus Thermoplasmatota archaeon]